MRRLGEFAAAGVSAYARTRNFVQPGHGNVSRLSAAVRHRLITEEEVIAAVLAKRAAKIAYTRAGGK